MNRLVQLLADLDHTNKTLQQLEINYQNKHKGEIFYKTEKHNKRKRATIEDKIRNFGKAYAVNKYMGWLDFGKTKRNFIITLVDVTEDEARTLIEMNTGGKIEKMVIEPIELHNLKFN